VVRWEEAEKVESSKRKDQTESWSSRRSKAPKSTAQPPSRIQHPAPDASSLGVAQSVADR